MKKTSIKDIAKLSGVSVATVSRVINDNGRFSEETREKVLAVIKENNYQMNFSAKSLRMNKSFSVGILVPDISNYFFSSVVQQIEAILFDQGYSTIICNTGRNLDKEMAYLNMLESKM
ncbi:LacI family DNA-binding transcriptional regulator, partial [Escherichia coli]